MPQIGLEKVGKSEKWGKGKKKECRCPAITERRDINKEPSAAMPQIELEKVVKSEKWGKGKKKREFNAPF